MRMAVHYPVNTVAARGAAELLSFCGGPPAAPGAQGAVTRARGAVAGAQIAVTARQFAGTFCDIFATPKRPPTHTTPAKWQHLHKI
jgi:hypothetical protein